MKIVLATRNRRKAIEIAAILGEAFDIATLDDVGFAGEIEETGETFAKNAVIKARAVCDACGLPTIADDSGLVVDALDGRPGVYSARFAGAHGDDRANNALVLKLLERAPAPRMARFVCAAALAMPGKADTVVTLGECEGEIAFAEEGENGFGYDPIFIYNGRSMATLTSGEKNAVSHRAAAFRKMAVVLGELQAAAR